MGLFIGNTELSSNVGLVKNEEKSSGKTIEAYNYSGKSITKGDWVHINETVNTTTVEYLNDSDIIGYSATMINPNSFITTFAGNANCRLYTYKDNKLTYVDLDGQAQRFISVDKDGNLFGGYAQNNCSYGVYNPNSGLIISGGTGFAYSNYMIEYDSGSRDITISKINKETGAVEVKYSHYTTYGINNWSFNGWVMNDNTLFINAEYIGCYNLIDNNNHHYYQYSSTGFSRCYAIGQITDEGILLGTTSRNGYGSIGCSPLIAYKYDYSTKVLSPYSKENFPTAMQECFENGCYPFWNEKYGIFMATIPNKNKIVCCQYIDGQWIDKSPIFPTEVMTNLTGDMPISCSSDLTTYLFTPQTDYYIKGFYILKGNENASGNYVVPYSYTNSESIMGKASTKADEAIGSKVSVIIPE